MNDFKVSVIIPVYDASKYVTQAVESALLQPETAEVILVEDGSTDGSLLVCQSLTKIYKKVRLLCHEDKKNHGAGASRNLGMVNARFEFLSFLDADDYYLPGRFTVAKNILMSDPSCDGVYEAIGKRIENEIAEKRWIEANLSSFKLTTMDKDIQPNELFRTLLESQNGYFSIDGLVIRRSLLYLSGLMNEALKLHQDMEFIFRLAYVGSLQSGRLSEPVTIRRIHENNRISAPRSNYKKYKDKLRMWKSLFEWLKKRSSGNEYQQVLEHVYTLRGNADHGKLLVERTFNSRIARRISFLSLIYEFPSIIFEISYWRILFPIKKQKKISH